ncbi:MAG: hypothetical protein AAFR15_08970 [Cyanobacteria bacterium J06627_15]
MVIASGVLEILTTALFGLRSQYALSQLASQDGYGSIAYEYEKNSYPLAMADLLWDDSASGLAFLQQLDKQANETLEVDFHSGFTLKGQTRKFFHFQDRLDPAYRSRMLAAMDRFTETDPLTRTADPPRKFWERSKDDCETPVDCRNTDNLRAMRDTSVYLMAEAAGNEATRLIYKEHLERYVSTLLDIGMGEWDSPTYHGHTTAAYLNLYDFAQDPEVKQLAQDALDWLFSAASLKYWRGDWNGPAKRVYGDGAAAFFWLYFGDGLPPTEVERDWIYGITSSYRPPEDVVAIATRRFPQPVEILRTHPHYENWKPELYGPAFYETLYFGRTFQLGSLAGGTGGDWSGFSLRVLTATGTDTLTVEADGPQRIAQYENVLIWYGESPQITFPAGERSVQDGVTFVKTDQAWLAVRPFDQGFVLEVSEAPVEFKAFKQAVVRQARLRHPVWFARHRVFYQASDGKILQLDANQNRPVSLRRDRHLPEWQCFGNLSEIIRQENP